MVEGSDGFIVLNDARAIRGLPLSIIGGAIAFVSDSSCRNAGSVVQVCTWDIGGTITLGNYILSDQPLTAKLFAHEFSQANQREILGNDVYGLTWITGRLLSNYHSTTYEGGNTGGGCYNPIEFFATSGGGYEQLCGW